MKHSKSLILLLFAGIAGCSRPVSVHAASPAGRLLRGQGTNGDWKADAPGTRHLIRVSDLPPANATSSIDNGPKVVARPEGAWPKVPNGFKIEEYATGLTDPRNIVTAPNGDIFVAESHAHRIRVLRDTNGDGKPDSNEIFASALFLPFGLAFYPPGPNPQYLYVGNTDSVVRFEYKNGDLKPRSAPNLVVDLPGGGRLRGGGHWTRDIAFSKDGKRMFVSVGSISNVHENPNMPDENRACIHEYTPDGKAFKLFATGIRNAVGIRTNPETGDLWASVNERDLLGDDLVPEYVTRVREGGFYGWPWFYMGPMQDPRHPGEHPELKNKVITPDVLIQSHSASLAFCFYSGKQFPAQYRGDAFVAEHGSWNRHTRTAYKIIRVPQKNGIPTGEYEDFVTGFVNPDGTVYGRPVGCTVASDGSLLFSDDGSGTIWRVHYIGTAAR